MNTQDKLNLNKSLAIAAPVLTAIHILGHFIAVLPVAGLVWWAMNTGGFMRIAIVGLASIYIFPLVLLLNWAIIMRLIPKPSIGPLTEFRDIFLNTMHVGLGYFAKMSTSRQMLSMIPFPGHIFYSIVSKGKIHPSVYIATPDCIGDAHLVEIGANTILGSGSVLTSHLQRNTNDTSLGLISIGKNVLIGVNSVIFPNVTIGDNSIVQTHSQVLPGTVIPANEIWGGIPARFIRKINTTKSAPKPRSPSTSINLEAL